MKDVNVLINNFLQESMNKNEAGHSEIRRNSRKLTRAIGSTGWLLTSKQTDFGTTYHLEFKNVKFNFYFYSIDKIKVTSLTGTKKMKIYNAKGKILLVVDNNSLLSLGSLINAIRNTDSVT